MASKIKSLFGGTKASTYPAPPTGHEASLSKIKPHDGTDLFRLMSKANKYSGAMTQRKQRKADEYAYMAGAMLHQNGVNDPRYQPYLHAYSQGGQYGMSNNLLNDFRSGSRKQSRVTRRTGHGHYANRPASHVPGKGRKAAAGSMFDYNDTDTSSSSSEDEGQARRY